MMLEILLMAFESLKQNKTRTILSMLGVIIGVSTVIAVFAIGKGAETAVDEQFSGLSAKSVIVMSMRGKGSTGSSKLKTSDAQMIRENSEYVEIVTGAIQGSKAVNYGTESSNFTIVGSDQNYFTISNLEIDQGKKFGEEAIDNKEKVAILGSGVVETLYEEGENVVGTTITVNGKKLEVIGSFKELGTSMGPMKIDDSVFVPFTSAESSLLGTGGSVMINMQMNSVDNVEIGTEEITNLLREEHGLKDSQEDDFRIMDAGSMVGAAQESAALMTTVLTLVAAIVLLVSGIGIMNVMFVTVAERTREIGIAKAIGAKQGDILSQFLFESVILSALGGIIGISLGQTAIPLISRFGGLAVTSTSTGPILGFGFSALVGIVFGFYPALKASRLDPVDALRSE